MLKCKILKRLAIDRSKGRIGHFQISELITKMILLSCSQREGQQSNIDQKDQNVIEYIKC